LKGSVRNGRPARNRAAQWRRHTSLLTLKHKLEGFMLSFKVS